MEIELLIYEDCLNLIDKFMQSKNPNFRTFCQKWHDAMFQHVYSVQTSAIEVIQTTKTILHLAKRIVCSKEGTGKLASNITELSRRFGGIYLMYAVYFKQPTSRHVKVLVSDETWIALTTFIEKLPVNDTTDEVRFVFWKLYKYDAFRFTAIDYDLGLENLIDYDRLYNMHNGNKYVDVRVKLKQKLTGVVEAEKVLCDMVSLEVKYNTLKESLGTSKSEKYLPSTTIFHDIQNTMKSIHNILDEDNDIGSSPVAKNNETRKEVKRRAAGYGINDEESPVEDNCQQEEAKKRCGRPTVRQIMTQELPEYIVDDLKDNSTEDELEKA